jgi:ribose 5-phosphate isomerase RpiB
MCTNKKYSQPFEKGKKRQYCLLELCHEQEMVDNAAERGSRCCGTGVGKRMFQDWWLGQRGAG